MSRSNNYNDNYIMSHNNANANANFNNDDDEALANSIQDQYRMEFLQRQAKKKSRARATAPVMEEVEIDLSNGIPNHNNNIMNTTSVNTNVDDDEALARRLQAEMDNNWDVERPAYTTTNTTTTNTTNTTLDEDARMAQQLNDEELARRYEQQVQQQQTQMLSSTFLDERSDDDDDTRQARRIAQELHDAEMAQRLSLYEQEADSRRQVAAQQQLQNANDYSNNRYRRLGRFLPLFCCGVILAVVLLLLLGVFDSQDIPFLGDLDPKDWIDNDPFSGQQAGGTNETPPESSDSFRWKSDGNGLTLELLNAVDDSWQSVLETAVQNWDNGSPIDSLTLSITRIPYEMNCKAEMGKLKICNGNYGNTKWRGLNEVLLNRLSNQIVSSAAKMNEYYLKYDNDDQKLYTMCHEIGHGFGLPHWDEDFMNADLGNCMDYTKNPAANKQPDTSNFEFLADLYGGRNITALAEGIPPKGRRLHSTIRFQQEEERRILQANAYSEVHWRVLDDETAILSHYLLAWEEGQ